MADDLTSRPWFIDVNSTGVKSKFQTFVKFIEVVGADAGVIGNTMADIQDQNGKSIVLAKYQTTGLGEEQTRNLENWFNGIKINALGTNVTLRIHIK